MDNVFLRTGGAVGKSGNESSYTSSTEKSNGAAAAAGGESSYKSSTEKSGTRVAAAAVAGGEDATGAPLENMGCLRVYVFLSNNNSSLIPGNIQLRTVMSRPVILPKNEAAMQSWRLRVLATSESWKTNLHALVHQRRLR